jgi:hypothetical protein
VKNSALGNLLWIIRINMMKNEQEGSFLMKAHLAFANKIARAIVSANIWEGVAIDVAQVTLKIHR